MPVADGRLLGLAPVCGPGTRLLLLGSFPGAASLAAQQYYAHPRNRFWRILGTLWGLDLCASSYASRCAALLDHGLGVWDVYAACRRAGSLDSAIEQAEPNDLAGLVARLPALAAIAHNGAESARSLRITGGFGLPVYRLPSTSPANAGWSFERQCATWGAVLAAHGLCAAPAGAPPVHPLPPRPRAADNPGPHLPASMSLPEPTSPPSPPSPPGPATPARTAAARPRRRPSAPAPLPEATISEFDGVRYLHLDSPWVQGAMRIRKPQALELEYIQRMMAWLLWRPTEALAEGHAVQLGLGAAAITRFAHSQLRWRSTAVELNPQVIAACRQWFHLPADDARLQVLCDDALHWLQQVAEPQSVDALSVDLYDHEAAAPVLDDAAFYAACHAVLADGGLMAVNLFGRSASLAGSLERIAAAFGAGQVWRLAATREGNTVVIAGRGVALPERPVLQARAEALAQRLGLPAAKWLRLIKPLA